MLMLCQTQHAFEEEAKAAEWRGSSVFPQKFSTRKLPRSWSRGCGMNIAGGVYFPNDCHLPPARFMHTMRERLTKSDVEFRWSTEVMGFRRDGNRVEGIETVRGELCVVMNTFCAEARGQR